MNAEDRAGERTPSGWWKPIAVVSAFVACAVVIWGWFRPEPQTPAAEPSPEADHGGLGQPAGGRAEAANFQRPPEWVRPTVLWTAGLVVSLVIGLFVLGLLRGVVTYLVLSLFFSFATEPAVNYAHARWHWRRGAATGLLLFLVLIGLILVVLILIPALLKGASAIADKLPKALEDLSRWASGTLGVDISTSSMQNGAKEAAASLESASLTPLSTLLGFTVSLVGGLFAAFTVGMFIFYMVAEATRFKRAVLSFFGPSRQEELLSIWEAAIDKTGGYFYSKLLLAGINGGLMFVVLLIVDVPGAAALAFFQGVVAAFIPIVGTYIAAVVPLSVALITVGWEGAVVVLIYVLIYQQVENYLISPRIQGKTMQLHPAVAFGAALAGAAIGGLLWAFLALPFAATVQASASLWIERHDVVASSLTTVEEPTPPEQAEDKAPILKRGRRWLASSRGWIRKRVPTRAQPKNPDR